MDGWKVGPGPSQCLRPIDAIKQESRLSSICRARNTIPGAKSYVVMYVYVHVHVIFYTYATSPRWRRTACDWRRVSDWVSNPRNPWQSPRRVNVNSRDHNEWNSLSFSWQHYCRTIPIDDCCERGGDIQVAGWICRARSLRPWLGPALATLTYVMYFRFCGWRNVCT